MKQFPVEIYRGVTFPLGVTYQNPDTTPIDLTGYSANFDVKTEIGGTDIINVTSAGTEITMGDAAGTINVVIPKAITNGLDADLESGFYNLTITQPDLETLLILEGDVTFKDPV